MDNILGASLLLLLKSRCGRQAGGHLPRGEHSTYQRVSAGRSSSLGGAVPSYVSLTVLAHMGTRCLLALGGRCMGAGAVVWQVGNRGMCLPFQGGREWGKGPSRVAERCMVNPAAQGLVLMLAGAGWPGDTARGAGGGIWYNE